MNRIQTSVIDSECPWSQMLAGK